VKEMNHTIKSYHVKNYWLIASVLRPFKLDVFHCYKTSDPVENALHSIVQAIEKHQSVIIPRGLGVIETFEKWYGPETHDEFGRVNRIHPLWQYLYSN
jgi:hypothetical protein